MVPRQQTIGAGVLTYSFELLNRRSRQRERLNAMGLSICLSVCLLVCVSKTSNLELWSVLMTYIGSRTCAFQRTHYLTPKIQDGGDPPS